jgi:hypothetical protein
MFVGDIRPDVTVQLPTLKVRGQRDMRSPHPIEVAYATGH